MPPDTELKRLIKAQSEDDENEYVVPERKLNGAPIRNFTSRAIDPDLTHRANWREHEDRTDKWIDAGVSILWLDDPAARWLGLAAEEAMYTGITIGKGGPRVPFPCPICEDSRPKGRTCPYCLRTGPLHWLPVRNMPRAHAMSMDRTIALKQARLSREATTAKTLAQRRAKKKSRAAVPA